MFFIAILRYVKILTFYDWKINFHNNQFMLINVSNPVTQRHFAHYISINGNRLLLVIHVAIHAKTWVQLRLLLVIHVVDQVNIHVIILVLLLSQVVVRVEKIEMHVMCQTFRIQSQ